MPTSSASPEKAFSETQEGQRIDEASGKRTSARDRVFAAAKALFYRRGISAVSVDSIAQEAGTTKMSLYRAFPGKDDLVAECLKESNDAFWRWWDDTVAPHSSDPRAALNALFEDITAKARTCEARGCAIGNASVELTEESHPARQVVVAFNIEKRRRLRELAIALNATEPDALADGLMLLMDGGYFSRLSLGVAGPSAGLPRAAKALIAAYAPD